MVSINPVLFRQNWCFIGPEKHHDHDAYDHLSRRVVPLCRDSSTLLIKGLYDIRRIYLKIRCRIFEWKLAIFRRLYIHMTWYLRATPTPS